MNRLIYILIILVVGFGCTKEVQIDIPGYQEQVVIDGRIETGQPPIVLISSSSEVYAPTDINAFLNGFISGATVTVSDGTNSVELTELCTNNLPAGTEDLASEILGIPVDQLSNYTVCAYVGLDPLIFGQEGKIYTLTVEYDGKTYTAETTILPPTSLVNSFWKDEEDPEFPNAGYSWCTLTDPAGQFDGYRWETNIIGHGNGDTSSTGFSTTYSPIFDDEFFDGLTFEFWYENPHGETNGWYYDQGDTVVIKLSKMDRTVFEFFEKKYVQLQTAGNPFATPTNIPTNLSNGALGIWAGFSPSFDTLICQP